METTEGVTMFEKEAEEEINKEHWTYSIFKDLAQEYWQKGAEFGYNKANEWHYVKDELPSESAMLLLARKTINGVQALIGYYRSNQFEIFNEKSCVMQNIDSVYAWKEIVLPKESE